MVGIDVAICSALLSIAKKNGKNYCYPAQVTIQILSKKFHGVCRSIRTFNRHLAKLEDAGFFQRVQRHYSDPVKGMVFRSTLYKLKNPLYRMLSRIVKPVWKRGVKLIKKALPVYPSVEGPELVPVPPEDQITIKEKRAIWRTKKALLQASMAI